MDNNTLWTLLSALAALGAAAFGYALYRVHRACGVLMPQLRTAYAPQAVDEAKQSPHFARFRALLFGALAALFLALLAVSRNAAPWLWLRNVMLALSTAAFLAAVAENITLPRFPRAASLCGKLKWGLMILWVAGMFVGLIAKGFSQF